MRNWAKYKHLVTDDNAIFLEECNVANVPPANQRFLWNLRKGPVWAKRTTARKRLVQKELRRRGIIPRLITQKTRKQRRKVIKLAKGKS